MSHYWSTQATFIWNVWWSMITVTAESRFMTVRCNCRKILQENKSWLTCENKSLPPEMLRMPTDTCRERSWAMAGVSLRGRDAALYTAASDVSTQQKPERSCASRGKETMDVWREQKLKNRLKSEVVGNFDNVIAYMMYTQIHHVGWLRPNTPLQWCYLMSTLMLLKHANTIRISIIIKHLNNTDLVIYVA